MGWRAAGRLRWAGDLCARGALPRIQRRVARYGDAFPALIGSRAAMAWNQSDGDKGVKRRSSPAVSAPPWWRRLKQRWAAGRGARGPLLGVLASLVALLWLMSGCYQIDQGQRAVLERFGAYAGERNAGLGWHLPWPIETLTRVDLGLLRSEGFQSRMLSSDLALLNIAGSVQYQWRTHTRLRPDPVEFLFRGDEMSRVAAAGGWHPQQH